jgi:hypothetical protein
LALPKLYSQGACQAAAGRGKDCRLLPGMLCLGGASETGKILPTIK